MCLPVDTSYERHLQALLVEIMLVDADSVHLELKNFNVLTKVLQSILEIYPCFKNEAILTRNPQEYPSQSQHQERALIAQQSSFGRG